jgi:hypothetical protein
LDSLVQMQNLNEECLLAFLQMPPGNIGSAETSESMLLSDLQRILRYKQYVSFPQAILIRRVVTLPSQQHSQLSPAFPSEF